MRMAVLRSSFLTLAFLSGLPTLIKMGSWVVFLIPFLVGLGLDVHAALGFCNCLALTLAAFDLEWPIFFEMGDLFRNGHFGVKGDLRPF